MWDIIVLQLHIHMLFFFQNYVVPLVGFLKFIVPNTLLKENNLKYKSSQLIVSLLARDVFFPSILADTTPFFYLHNLYDDLFS